MPRAKYDLLKLPPVHLFLEGVAFLGRLAEQRLSDAVANESPLLPLAVPIADCFPIAARLEGWIAREQAHRIAARLQQTERDLQQREVELRQAKAEVERLGDSLIVMSAMSKSGHTTSALSSLSKEYEAAFSLNSELNQRVCRLKAVNSELSAKLERADARLKERDEADRTAAAASQGGHRVREERLADLIQVMFPKLDFMRRSAYFLVRQAHNLGKTLERLRELNDTGRLGGAKRVQNSKIWLEVRFGTEGSSVDRLYYSQSSEAGRFVVVLSNKNMQESDFRRLNQIRRPGE